jgi:hypothetical protein
VSLVRWPPGNHDDLHLLSITFEAEDCIYPSLCFDYTFAEGDDALAVVETVDVTLAWLDGTCRPDRVPHHLTVAFAQGQEDPPSEQQVDHARSIMRYLMSRGRQASLKEVHFDLYGSDFRRGSLTFGGVKMVKDEYEDDKWKVDMPGPLRLFTMVPAI